MKRSKRSIDCRVNAYDSDRVTPPAAVIAFPDSYDFDQTFQRGFDRIVIPVTVVVGRADSRSSRDRMTKYAAGSGPDSVKHVVESHSPTSYDSARVLSVEFGAVTIAAVTYLAATFDIEIIAAGV